MSWGAAIAKESINIDFTLLTSEPSLGSRTFGTTKGSEALPLSWDVGMPSSTQS
jgi:hypothetical protein